MSFKWLKILPLWAYTLASEWKGVRQWSRDTGSEATGADLIAEDSLNEAEEWDSAEKDRSEVQEK